MVKQILMWLVFAWLWWAIIFYSAALAEMFGRVGWFEKNLWWTRNGYVMVGFGVVVIGFLILFGVIPTSAPTQNLWTLGTGA